MKKFLLLLVFISLLNSCADRKQKDDSGAWFGGQIINPTADFVVFTKNDVVIDSIYLDADNKFLYRIEKVDKGIYNFIHNEYQIIYLEPDDSLMLHVNTLEFDESLAFSGEGSKKNNFLINMFLHNEKEAEQMPRFYLLEVDAFTEKLDSMKANRMTMLNNFLSKKDACTHFSEIAKASIVYDYYLKKEVYPFAHYGFGNTEKHQNLPENYYNFREKVDYNNPELQSYYPYYRFLNQHFDYLAFESYNTESSTFNRESYIHNYHKLNLINQKVSLESLKNKLLRTTIRTYLINAKELDEEKKLLELYLSYNTNAQHASEINQLAASTVLLLPGNKLPVVKVEGRNGVKTSLSEIIRRPTVIYFWSTNWTNHHKNVHAKADELKQKYPEFDFIAVSTDEQQEVWLQTLIRNSYIDTYEYRFTEKDIALQNLVINSINKVLIVDKNGFIIDNHANLFRNQFEEQLLGILNQ